MNFRFEKTRLDRSLRSAAQRHSAAAAVAAAGWSSRLLLRCRSHCACSLQNRSLFTIFLFFLSLSIQRGDVRASALWCVGSRGKIVKHRKWSRVWVCVLLHYKYCFCYRQNFAVGGSYFLRERKREEAHITWLVTFGCLFLFFEWCIEESVFVGSSFWQISDQCLYTWTRCIFFFAWERTCHHLFFFFDITILIKDKGDNVVAISTDLL